MSRLESIKERFEQYEKGMKEFDNTPTNAHFRELLAPQHRDVSYLLELVERYKTALKEVRVSTSQNHAKYVADKALKEGNHE